MNILSKLRKKLRIDFNKNTKINFYLKGMWILLSPQFLYKKDLDKTYNSLSNEEQEYLKTRVNYYNKLDTSFVITDEFMTISKFSKKKKKKTYFFDLLEYVKHFDFSKKIAFLFGDIIDIPNIPTFVKSRPINGNNKNSIVMKLDKVRHFIFSNDPIMFEDKKDLLVWRGKVHKEQPHRVDFMKKCFDLACCDVGQTNTKENQFMNWQKGKLDLKEHFHYKFILAIEGNDVASNLKWAMSSNSLVMMIKPVYETWFMEGVLIPNIHYVLLKNDYSDLEEKIKYYSTHIDESKQIIKNANKYCNQFKNNLMEDVVSYKVIEKYFKYSNQMEKR